MARPLTVTVASGGVDTSVPTGPEIGAPFVIVGPDGTRAAFNDQTDRDFVAMLTDVSGLDAPDIRESADDLVQMDGGIHGNFYYGRRPITLTGLVLNPASVDERNRRMTKIMRACRALRADATLSWTLSGGQSQFVKVRLQSGPRFTGAWQKEFIVGLVAADPRIYSTIFQTQVVDAITGAMTVTNNGNAPTWPYLVVHGSAVSPVVSNNATGESITTSAVLNATSYLTFDTLNRTVVKDDPAIDYHDSLYSSIIFASTDWWAIQPGDNPIVLAGTSFGTGASLTVQWRDAWL
jgi:hypothetical protein